MEETHLLAILVVMLMKNEGLGKFDALVKAKELIKYIEETQDKI